MKLIHTSRTSVTLALVFTSATISSAQSGPGGVGSTDGTSALAIWLRGDAGTYQTSAGSTAATATSDPVGRWEDGSGYGRNVIQATSTRRPLLNAAALNGHTTLTFDNTSSGNEDDLRSSSISPALSQPLTLFAVASKSGSGSTAQSIVDSRTAGSNTMVLGYSGTTQARINAGSDVTVTMTQSSAAIFSAVYNGTSSSLAVDGGSPGTGDAGARTADGITVGANRSTAQFLNGEIAEVILYSASLLSAESIIIENYLGAKYGIAVGTDVYASSTYSVDVAGIGREADGAHSLSYSSGLILIDNGALDASGEYLLAGHDGTAQGTSTADLPAGMALRWSRVWFLDKTGTLDGADVQIAFDYGDAGLLPLPSSTSSDYQLLRRSGTSGTFSTVSVSDVAINGNRVVFTVPDSSVSDGYFTIGFGTPDYTLPVELASFDAAATDAGVELTWRTASEVDNAGFVIERRMGDDGDFATIASYRTDAGLLGLGSTAVGRSYRWTDRDALAPGATVTYRLSSAHPDGSLDQHVFTRTLTLPAPDSEPATRRSALRLGQNMPNPASGTTVIPYELAEPGRAEIVLFDALGRRVAAFATAGAAGENRFELDASGLPPGMYYYRITAGHAGPIRRMLVAR